MPKSKSKPEEQAQQDPGKARTWWHPLLVRLLTFELAGIYDVQGEVSVGKVPMRLDVLLVHQRGGRLSAAIRRELGSLAKLLNKFTFIEFKAPTDDLEHGDFDYLLGCVHMFRSQNDAVIRRRDVTLIVVAPQLTKSFRADLRASGLRARKTARGIYSIEGPAIFPVWIVETNVVNGPHEPLLTLFSRLALREGSRIINELRRRGFTRVVSYAAQQINQFQQAGEAFAMQHRDTELMDDMFDEFIEALSVERRLKGIPASERVKGLSASERVKGLSASERVKGLPASELLEHVPADEFLKAMTPEALQRLSKRERSRLLKLLGQQRSN